MKTGVVIIGRNEGVRLQRCIESITVNLVKIVYVDSGSTDNSVSMACTFGIDVINLDMTQPFTAARARNEGFRNILKKMPNIEYIQFVDGDCEVNSDWINNAILFLNEHQDVAAVCGRLRERYPAQSIYNMLCDWEWDTPVGEAKACGGNAMYRANALEKIGGYREDMIAGEEPELCLRLRESGWKIWRIEVEMALHDAAMLHFSQWWKRTKRGGYSFAHGAFLHKNSPERHGVKQSRSSLIWGLYMPVFTVGLIIWLGSWGLFMLLIYPMQIIRLTLGGKRTLRENWWRALFLVLGKFPEMLGQLSFLYKRYTGKKANLIEYK